MNSENRGNVRRAAQARDDAQARVRSLTVTVTAASVVAVGALAVNLPGSAHATVKSGDGQRVAKPAPSATAPSATAPATTAPAPTSGTSGLSSGSAPAPSSGGGQVTSGGS